MKTKILILIVIIIAVRVNAETRFVSKTGTSIPPYTSWATAADKIQTAINICKPGDTVYVGNGTYIDTVRMTPGIALIGSGMDSCVIDVRKFKTRQYNAVRIEDSCAIENFKIIVSDGNEDEIYGEAIGAINSRIVIKNNMIVNPYYAIYTSYKSGSVIANNFISGVVGIILSSYDFNNEITIYNNIFNISESGLNLISAGRPLIRNNIIKVSDNGIAYDWSSSDTVSIYNNLVYCENCMAGFFNLIKSQLVNNVIYGNFGDRGVLCNGKNIIKNNIVSSLNRGVGIVGLIGTPPSIIKYNNSFNNKNNYLNLSQDSTNISVDPMFVNPDSLDFRLQMFSPMIDAGDPEIKDLDGTRSDIGLFGGPYGETYTYQDIAPRPPVNISLTKQVKNLTVSWNKNTEADFSYYKIYKSGKTGFIIDTANFVSSTSDTLFYDKIKDSSFYKVTAVDKQGNESKASVEAGYIITGINELKLTEPEYNLYNNYPNPFNPATKISYRLKEAGNVKLTIYDIKGERIATLLNEEKEAGYHETEFNPSKSGNLASGVYICRIDIKNRNNIPVYSGLIKMILIK